MLFTYKSPLCQVIQVPFTNEGYIYTLISAEIGSLSLEAYFHSLSTAVAVAAVAKSPVDIQSPQTPPALQYCAAGERPVETTHSTTHTYQQQIPDLPLAPIFPNLAINQHLGLKRWPCSVRAPPPRLTSPGRISISPAEEVLRETFVPLLVHSLILADEHLTRFHSPEP
jgi:hypothetical protein